MVVCRLSKEINLFVWKLIDCVLQVVSNFVVGYVIFEIGDSLVVGHDFKFFDLKSPPGKNCLDGFFNEGCEGLFVDGFNIVWVEAMDGEIFGEGTGYKPADSFSGLILIC